MRYLECLTPYYEVYPSQTLNYTRTHVHNKCDLMANKADSSSKRYLACKWTPTLNLINKIFSTFTSCPSQISHRNHHLLSLSFISFYSSRQFSFFSLNLDHHNSPRAFIITTFTTSFLITTLVFFPFTVHLITRLCEGRWRREPSPSHHILSPNSSHHMNMTTNANITYLIVTLHRVEISSPPSTIWPKSE